jgi:hypothetical protein
MYAIEKFYSLHGEPSPHDKMNKFFIQNMGIVRYVDMKVIHDHNIIGADPETIYLVYERIGKKTSPTGR